MTRIHLRTFLANACRDSVKNVQRFSRYGLPGSKGHNYFWSSDQAIQKMVIAGEVYDQVIPITDKIDKDDERLTNQALIQTFNSWWVGHKREGYLPPTGIIKAPKEILSVGIYPTFALKKKPADEIILAYACKERELPKGVAGLGVYAMKTALDPDGSKGLTFVVHDLLKGVRHCEGSIPNHPEATLLLELTRQEEAFIATRKAA